MTITPADLSTAKAVLAAMSLHDPRAPRPDTGVLVAWANTLAGIDRDRAVAAVHQLYRDSGERVMAADVRRIARGGLPCERTAQLALAGTPAFNAERNRRGTAAGRAAIAAATARRETAS